MNRDANAGHGPDGSPREVRTWRPPMNKDQPQDRTNPWLESGRGDGGPLRWTLLLQPGDNFKIERITIDKKIKRCPKCGSTDIVSVAGMMTGYKYHCRKCDYVGVLILEEDLENNSER